MSPAVSTALRNSSITPKGEDLRRAVAWLAEHHGWTMVLIEEACQRFDLSPADEEFLFREFRRWQAPRNP